VQLYVEINMPSDFCSLIFLGPTNAKTVAKCNLGKVKPKIIIVSQWLLPAGMCGVPLLPGPAQRFAYQRYFACICCLLRIAPILLLADLCGSLNT